MDDREIAKELTLAMLAKMGARMKRDDKNIDVLDVEGTADMVGTLYRRILKAVEAGAEEEEE